ncbi:50S ribosomal protein L28 [Acanthopleuribacter pedis]|uniref:Large ribosomal subunit protein bL28 n=1 Tax=Acanthopleuribacter pedis TaxID=442870 RepID=A0A8J7U449_9BACT|nr:50S ribosomal protein L28 [Acanthopleuribacter pedis]
MAKSCSVCSKGYQKGHKISHAHNVSLKRWYPNLQRVRVQQPNGGTKRQWVCTSCIQKGMITKRSA